MLHDGGSNDDNKYSFEWFCRPPDESVRAARKAMRNHCWAGFGPYQPPPELNPEYAAMKRMTAAEVNEAVAAMFGPHIASAVKVGTH